MKLLPGPRETIVSHTRIWLFGSQAPGVTPSLMFSSWLLIVLCMSSEHTGGFRDLKCSIFLREVEDFNP